MATTTTHSTAEIRTYQAGDEEAQVAIYNAATGDLPGFKRATVEDVQRRSRAAKFDASTKLYAVQGGSIVGYVSFSDNGRVSAPWCVAGAEHVRAPLMQAALERMQHRGHKRAWAAYRADWPNVLALLESLGFHLAHEVSNFVAELAELPREPAPSPMSISAITRQQLPAAYAVDESAFVVASAAELADAWLDGPYISGDSLFALHDGSGNILGVALAVINAAYADATKIDSAMPCFRLGAIRTELERTKRVNGLFSYVAQPGPDNHRFGRWLLGEAARRFDRAGLAHAAAQCPGNRPIELAFFQTYFQQQKSFPIFVLDL
jgi:predicted N-acetyltransferase YhbS